MDFKGLSSRKAVVSVAMCFILAGCFFKVPFGYYQFARISMTAGACYLAYWSFENKQPYLSILYVPVALLFQPFVIIHFTRATWQVIDLIALSLLIVAVFINRKTT